MGVRVGGGVIHFEDVPQVELMRLVFHRMPGERCRRQLGSLLLGLLEL